MQFDLGYPASDYESDRPGYRGTSLQEFFDRFPDEEACLAQVFQRRFGRVPLCPRCGRASLWYRIQGTKRFQHSCGKSISPLAGTLLHRTSTSLQLWFYVMLHFANSVEGVNSLFLQRHAGICRKAAYRMGDRIRLHMAALDHPSRIGGPRMKVEVRVDLLEGVRTTGGTPRVVFLTDRQQMQTTVIGRARRHMLHAIIADKVLPGSATYTSCPYTHSVLTEFGSRPSRVPYDPEASSADPYIKDPVRSFQTYVQRPLQNSYRRVELDNLWKYLKEFEFRYNRRHRSQEVFSDLVAAFPLIARDNCADLSAWSSRGLFPHRNRVR